MVAPTGPISLPVDFLRKTVADTAAFRTETGTASQVAALAFVHTLNSDLPTQTFYATVEWEEGLSFTKTGGGARNYFEQRGELQLLFSQTITETTDEDAVYDFLNLTGAIVQQMLALSGTAGYLDFDAIRLVLGPIRPDDKEGNALGGADFRAIWTVSYLAVPE